MAPNIVVDRFGEIVEGHFYRGYCHISIDRQEDGFFIMVYKEPDTHSEVLLSEWLPSLQAVNYFVRNQNWKIDWDRDQ